VHAFRVRVEIKFRLRSYVTLCFKYIYENSNSGRNDKRLLLLQSTQWNAFAYRMSDIFCFTVCKRLSRGLSIIWSVGEPYDLKTTHNMRIGSVTWSPFENIFKSQFTLLSYLYYSPQRNLIVPSIEDRNHKKEEATYKYI